MLNLFKIESLWLCFVSFLFYLNHIKLKIADINFIKTDTFT